MSLQLADLDADVESLDGQPAEDAVGSIEHEADVSRSDDRKKSTRNITATNSTPFTSGT